MPAIRTSTSLETIRLLTRRKALMLGGSLAAALACDLHVAVEGVVQDASGHPLEDVTVSLRMAGRAAHTTQTTRSGTFDVGMVGAEPANVTLSFEKEGYLPVTRMVGPDAQSSVKVVLQAARSPR